MTKIYSLFAATLFAATISGQTVVLTENFSAYALGGNTSSSGASGPHGTDVYSNSTNVSSFPTGSRVYQAGGMAKFGSSSQIGTMTTGALDLSTDGGNVRVTVDVKGWTTVEGPLVITLSGLAPQEVTYTALMNGSPQTVSVEFPAGGTASSTVTIASKARRAYVDNVKIETYDPTLATVDFSSAKATLVKNTIVNNDIIFAQDAKVSVVNMNGQVVKSALVTKNGSLNVAELPKGTYLVTAVVNGKAVSQKVIKK